MQAAVCLLLVPATCLAGASQTTGFWEEMRAGPSPHSGPPRSGRQVYEYRCKACHAKNTFGAPLPGDRLDWGRRVQQGIDVLLEHALHGYRGNLMPPKGGCRNCSAHELRAAIRYMLRKSGIDPDAVGPGDGRTAGE